jgi:hypothetical protein
MVSQIESEIVTISYAGERYYLGFSDKFFAIYDKLDRRGTFTEPVQIFQKTQEGWEQAWHLFSSWEPHCRQIPTKVVNVTHANEIDDEKTSAGMAGLDKNYSRPMIVLKSSATGLPEGRYQPIIFEPIKNPINMSIVTTGKKHSAMLSKQSSLNYKALLGNVISLFKAIFARIDDLIQNPSDALKYQRARFNSLISKRSVQPQRKAATVASNMVYSPAITPQHRSGSPKTFKLLPKQRSGTKYTYRKNSKSKIKSVLLFVIALVIGIGAVFGYMSYKNNEISKAFPGKAQSICSVLTAKVDPLAQQINANSQSQIQLITDISSIKIAQANAFYQLVSIAPQSLKAQITNVQANLATITAAETNLSNAIGASQTTQIVQDEKTLAALNATFNSNLTTSGIGTCATTSF